MGRSLNRDSDASVSVPERRSLRNSKNDEEVKPSPTPKARRSIAKKKDEKTENKNEDTVENKNDEKAENKNEKKTENKNDKKTESKNDKRAENKNDYNSETDTEEPSEKNHDKKNDADGNDSNTKATTSESPSSKPVSSRSVRSTRKRPLEKTLSDEDEPEEVDDKSDENTNEKIDGDSENKEADKDDDDKTETKNDKSEDSVKEKAKKKRKPPTKKKKGVPDESELWTPLEPLDTEEKKDSHKKAQSKSDRRKQALVERQAPAEPMLQRQLPRQRRNSDNSECEVLVSVPRHHRKSKTIVTVDIDDEASETGSIQIVAEPDVDSVFDFKRLLIQYRSVNLPSALWGVHKDPRNLFVSFTRFNPDYPDTNGLIVDRAVVFPGTLNPEAFVNGEKIELPDMFNVVETIFEAAQVVEFINNTVIPVIQPTIQSTDEAC